jgi:hypothetical protein
VKRSLLGKAKDALSATEERLNDPTNGNAAEVKYERAGIGQQSKLLRRLWRRGSGSNRRIKVLQTSPLPLGYRASGGLCNSALLDDRRSVPQAGFVWSGRPGSNRRHLPWQGSTLPLSYSRSSGSSIAAMFGMVNAMSRVIATAILFLKRHAGQKTASHLLTGSELASAV